MVVEKNWVEGFATIPFYLVSAFILTGFMKLEALSYVVSMLLLLFAFGALYRFFVVRRVRNGSNSWWVLGQWYLGQILIITGAWYVSFIAITAST